MATASPTTTLSNAALYSVAVSPVDNSIWGTSLGFPGYVVRLNPGPNPPESALAEVFEPPLPGYGPRGGDIDRNGVFWASLSSGHLGSFVRMRRRLPTESGQDLKIRHEAHEAFVLMILMMTVE
jgi:hypothetical protein